MNRSQFEHAIRAAAAVVGENEVMVVGSQAVHASVESEIPEVARRSVEADIVLFNDTDSSKADLVDGSIGEASMFHETFGFYAQGISIESVILPVGWEDRLVRFESPATQGVVAWCLSPDDLWVSKALAARPKDLEFCRVLLDQDAVDRDRLAGLISTTDTHEAKKQLALNLLRDQTPSS